MPSLSCYPPIYVSCVDGMTGAYHHVQLLLVELESHELLSSWSPTIILPISAS
jgi:hypothetical protein